jgi:hypothetical protein
MNPHYRVINGQTVYTADPSNAEGDEAGLRERTAIGKFRDGSFYLRAADGEDARMICKAAQELGIGIEKRRSGASHFGRLGAYDHFHVPTAEDAAKIQDALGERPIAKAKDYDRVHNGQVTHVHGYQGKAKTTWESHPREVRAMSEQDFKAHHDELEEGNQHDEARVLRAKRFGSDEHIAEAEANHKHWSGKAGGKSEEDMKKLNDLDKRVKAHGASREAFKATIKAHEEGSHEAHKAAAEAHMAAQDAHSDAIKRDFHSRMADVHFAEAERLKKEREVHKSWDESKRERLKRGEIQGFFAGPGESFPVAGPEDVKHAWDLAGHTEDPAAVRRSIIAGAKKYGWASGLPEDARSKDEEESGREIAKSLIEYRVAQIEKQKDQVGGDKIALAALDIRKQALLDQLK